MPPEPLVKQKICFMGVDNYPVLNPAFGADHFGDESVQHVLLAKAFVELDYEVSMDHGQKQGELRQNIRVRKTCAEGGGLPVIRFVYPRFVRVWQALNFADADIYYQTCAGALTSYVALFCQKYARRFIFRLAHDSDCIPGSKLIKHWRDRKIYEYGLRRANRVVALGGAMAFT